jgi:hypothetical protein
MYCKHLLSAGIETGHGSRVYLIDVSSGEAKPVTPEGFSGTRISPNGASVPVLGPDGKWGIWPLAGGENTTRPRPTQACARSAANAWATAS